MGQHVSQQANDSQEVARALDEMEETSGRLPEKLSLDNGYYSGKNLQEVSDRQVEAYVATDRGERRGKGELEESERRLVKADFRYDEERDGFHCPGGQLLRLKTTPRHGTAGVSGGHRGVPILCLLSSLLPVEVRGGAHDHERREGAVATGDERADVETGEPGALRASQDDRRAGIRADQELGISGIRAAGQGEIGRGVLAGLRGTQSQKDHACGSAGRGVVSGVREASGLGVKKGRIRADEVKNRPL